MTALQKTLVIVTMFAAVGMVYYEADQAATLRAQVQSLQRQQASLSQQIGQLRSQHVDAAKSAGSITGILSDPNYRVVIHALENRNGFEQLAEPEVVHTSGRGIQGRFVWFDIPATSAAANPSSPSRQPASR